MPIAKGAPMSVGNDRTEHGLDITVVESEGCHYCTDAHDVLEEFSATYPLQVSTVPLTSDMGRALVQRHRPALSPLVLVDGEFFSQGRLPRRKLAKLLASRLGAPAEAPGA